MARILKRLSLAAAIILVVCGGIILFIQFYPFAKSPLFSKMNYPLKTATKSGKPGDPVNVMILGTQQDISRYFKEAGWKVPDPITEKTSIKIAVDSLRNLPYPTAPVSNLYLYKRKQDLAFEKPTTSVRNRDHVRLWDTHTALQGQEVWLGSATYDHGIELSRRNDLPTHHISPSVDGERDRVVQDVTSYVKSAFLASFDQPNLFGFNGGGDWYYTDGNIAVLSDRPLKQQDFSAHSPALSLKQALFQILSPVLNLL